MNQIDKVLLMALSNPQLGEKLAFFSDKYSDIETRASALESNTTNPSLRGSKFSNPNQSGIDMASSRANLINLPVYGPIFFDDGSTYIGQFKKG